MLGPWLGERPHDTLTHVLGLRPTGHAAEFGVYRGTTLRMIADVMPVTGFDVFTGLPEDWRPGFDRGQFACQAPEIEGADLVVGLFADTLPSWKPPAPLGLVHIDCDLYSSTETVLTHLEPHLGPGCYIVFDEFHGYATAERHEARAWASFEKRTGVDYDVIGHGREQWAIRLR